MTVQIITPEKVIYSGEANLVQLPGTDGSFEILKNHTAMISTLKKGKVKVEVADKSVETFEINGGVVEVLKNKVIVLAD
jgi:F-type H+-transporting ATPase subunit epsilon